MTCSLLEILEFSFGQRTIWV